MLRSIFCRSRLRCVERLRDRQRFGFIAGEQQVQRFLGGFQPAGGVQARRELEADFIRADGLGALGDFFQRHQSGALRGVQSFQAGGNQHPVFAGQRNDVGNRAQRDQIEQRTQIKFGEPGRFRFRARVSPARARV